MSSRYIVNLYWIKLRTSWSGYAYTKDGQILHSSLAPVLADGVTSGVRPWPTDPPASDLYTGYIAPNLDTGVERTDT